MHFSRLALAFALWASVSLWGGEARADSEEYPESLDCALLDCAAVLPGAVAFEAVERQAYARGVDAAGDPIGWVALSTDIVDVPAYSGKPLATLVGLSLEGVITGAEVVHHSEPILLVGIPRSALDDFVHFYTGQEAIARIVVGRAPDENAIAVDVISGATVTALAQNQTILETARLMGVALGVIDLAAVRPGRFVDDPELWDWARMEREGVFGRLTVSEEEMGDTTPHGAFIDLWYAIADAPQVGRSLLGDGDYEHYLSLLEPGEHIVIVLGNGSNSFKGSAFVRGGIFDRVRIRQGLTEITFRDTDYWNLSRPRALGAPAFREGAIFLTRSGSLDPGSPYEMVFLGSRYDRRGAFSREFHEFASTHQLPTTVYVVEGQLAGEAIWVQAWRNRKYDAIALTLYFLFIIAIFSLRRFTTANLDALKKLHLGTMIVSFLMVGVYMKAQPSVTQILTLIDSLVHDFRMELFASEPLLMISWIFIFIVSLIWGRGVFCGWVCPYGVMTELLFKVAEKLGVKHFELPDGVHRWLRYLRYAILLALIPIYLHSPILAEKLAEVEPFKSTFLVPVWEREWYLFAWWALLVFLSTFWYRPFCRYVCPLGGGLAIFNRFRASGPYRRNFCSSCTICTKACEPRAIDSEGRIDPMECLSCMECESTYRAEERCPPLVGIERLLMKGELSSHDEERLTKLRVDKRKV